MFDATQEQHGTREAVDTVLAWRFELDGATAAVAAMSVEHDLAEALGDEPLAEDLAMAVDRVLEAAPGGTLVELGVDVTPRAVVVSLALSLGDLALDPDVQALADQVEVRRHDHGVAVVLRSRRR